MLEVQFSEDLRSLMFRIFMFDQKKILKTAKGARILHDNRVWTCCKKTNFFGNNYQNKRIEEHDNTK